MPEPDPVPGNPDPDPVGGMGGMPDPDPVPGNPEPDPGMVGMVGIPVPDPPDPKGMVVAPAVTKFYTFYILLHFVTKLNSSLLELALALLDGEGDNVEVHAVPTQLNILGCSAALLVARDQA